MICIVFLVMCTSTHLQSRWKHDCALKSWNDIALSNKYWDNESTWECFIGNNVCEYYVHAGCNFKNTVYVLYMKS